MHKNSDFMVKKKSNLDDSSTGGNTDEIKMKLSRLKAKLKDSKRKKPVTKPKPTPKKTTIKKKAAKYAAPKYTLSKKFRTFRNKPSKQVMFY